jgi:hypothetical protein
METQPLARELPRLAPAALEALARASGSLPPGRSMVNAVDIVLAVLGLDGAGARVVEVVAPGRLAEVEAVLAGGQAAVPHGATDFGELDMPDGSVVYMDVTAREVVDGLADLVGRTADTKDLLLAESRRQSSVLVDALATLGIGGDRSILAPELAALAKRVGQDPAVGGRTLVSRPVRVHRANRPVRGSHCTCGVQGAASADLPGYGRPAGPVGPGNRGRRNRTRLGHRRTGYALASRRGAGDRPCGPPRTSGGRRRRGG